MKPVVVVGAGLAGLTVAKALKAPVIEKSRGVGGRVATRRIDDQRFDHGLPYWPRNPYANRLARDLSFPSGLTSIAKQLAEGLEIYLEERVIKIDKLDGGWKLVTDKNNSYEAQKVIITAPVPQALELLDKSGIGHRPEWEVPYYKSLVGLYRLSLGSQDKNHMWDEHEIILQREKGLCSDGVVLLASPAFSDLHFEKSDEEILKLLTELLTKKLGKRTIKHAELKKWRYSMSKQVSMRPYCEASPGLFLCGDGFLFSGVEGALASAETLLKEKFSVII